VDSGLDIASSVTRHATAALIGACSLRTHPVPVWPESHLLAQRPAGQSQYGRENASRSEGAVNRRTGSTFRSSIRIQQCTKQASNAELGDRFGAPVAIIGDTIVVGALGEDSGAEGVGTDEDDNSQPDSGAVYVFVRDPVSGWRQQAYLKPSSVDFSDNFGLSLSLDGNRLAVVSASNEFETGKIGRHACRRFLSPAERGRRFVFRRADDGSWPQDASLRGSNTEQDDGFGIKVAVDGDLLTVSANGEASSASGIDQDLSDNASPYSGSV
jgi:hypothetical protein